VKHTNIDDAQLMRRTANGDETALGLLYDRYGRLVFSVAYHVLNDQTLAEETTQEVFLRVWQKADSYHPEQGRLAPWLASIARRRAIDLYRRRQRSIENRLTDTPVEDAFDLADPEDVENEAQAAEQRRRVRQALAALPEVQRQALAYAFFRGYSHSQIAALTGEPLGTVKTRIRLAMLKLRDLLSDELEEAR
jgi:RNA polymerase sigma-70 factor (ECF subfamily)